MGAWYQGKVPGWVAVMYIMGCCNVYHLQVIGQKVLCALSRARPWLSKSQMCGAKVSVCVASCSTITFAIHVYLAFNLLTEEELVWAHIHWCIRIDKN